MSSDSGDEFEVEQILGKRTRNGRTKYKIRWKGFDESDDTWEVEENLTNCRSLLEEYDRDRERDRTLIHQTLINNPSLLNGTGIRSPLWSSTPAPDGGSPLVTSLGESRLRWDDSVVQRVSPKKSANRGKTTPPEKLRLRWDDTVDGPMTSPKMKYQTGTDSKKNESGMAVTPYIDEPASRWPLLAFLLLVLGLSFYYAQWRLS